MVAQGEESAALPDSDGSANAGSDYEYAEGSVVFKPGDTRKEIKVREGGKQVKHTE